MHVLYNPELKVFAMFRLPFLRRKQDNITPQLYQQLIKQARDPWFYTIAGVDDTQQGRFEVICIHMFMVLQRMKAHKKESQELFDYFFHDMDRSLREMGVGDLSVGKKIKSMLKLFYYRVDEYQKNPDDYTKALDLFFKERKFQVSLMNAYLKKQVEHLARCTDEELLKGHLTWNNEVEDVTATAA